MDSSLINVLYPIHPKLVHFPVALTISAMGIQVLGIVFKKDGWCKAAWLMFVLAVIAMPIVIFAGLFEAARLNLHHPVLNAHKTFAFWTVGVAFTGLMFLWLNHESRFFRAIFLILLFVVSCLLTMTAYEGGRMVYEYGVGVSQ